MMGVIGEEEAAGVEVGELGGGQVSEEGRIRKRNREGRKVGWKLTEPLQL